MVSAIEFFKENGRSIGPDTVPPTPHYRRHLFFTLAATLKGLDEQVLHDSKGLWNKDICAPLAPVAPPLRGSFPAREAFSPHAGH